MIIQLSDRATRARALCRQSELSADQGNLQAAMRFHTEAQEFVQAIIQEKEASEISFYPIHCRTLAGRCRLSGRNEEAAVLEEEASHFPAASNQSPRNTIDEADEACEAGLAAFRRGEYLKAVEHYEQALRRYDALYPAYFSARSRAAECAFYTGASYCQGGHYSEAERWLREAEKRLRAILSMNPNRAWLMLYRTNYALAVTFKGSGEAETAVSFLREALLAARNVNDDGTTLHGSLKTLANYMCVLGRPEEAVMLLEERASLFRRPTDQAGRSALGADMADIASACGQLWQRAFDGKKYDLAEAWGRKGWLRARDAALLDRTLLPHARTANLHLQRALSKQGKSDEEIAAKLDLVYLTDQLDS